jgi:hypothetical protein
VSVDFELILLDTGAEESSRLNYVRPEPPNCESVTWFLGKQQVTLLACRTDQQGILVYHLVCLLDGLQP